MGSAILETINYVSKIIKIKFGADNVSIYLCIIFGHITLALDELLKL